MARKVWLYQKAGMWHAHVQAEDGTAPREPTFTNVTKSGLITRVNNGYAAEGLVPVDREPSGVEYMEGELPTPENSVPPFAIKLHNDLVAFGSAAGVPEPTVFARRAVQAVLSVHDEIMGYADA